MSSVAPEHHPIVPDIERACKEAGISFSDFGRLAVNDGSLMADLRRGREPRRKTMHRIRATLMALRARAADAPIRE